MPRKPKSDSIVPVDIDGISASVDDINPPVDSIDVAGNEPEVINGFATFDPGDAIDRIGTASGDDSGGGTKRRRGRPPGSGAGAKKTNKTVHLGGVEKILYSVHMMMGAVIAPELALNEAEAATYAEAINEVSKHYNNYIDPKLMAWINLAICVGGIYVPRVIAIRNRVASEETTTAKPKLTVVPAPAKNGNAANVPLTPADLFGMEYNAHLAEPV